MNLSDGGVNRGEMRDIGTAGLERVLRALGRWPAGGLQRDEARQALYGWSGVRGQLTRIEALCKENGIVQLYNPKAHPIFNAIEALALAFHS